MHEKQAAGNDTALHERLTRSHLLYNGYGCIHAPCVRYQYLL